MSRNIVITGIGIVSAAGCGAEAVWDSFRAGRTGLRPMERPATIRWGGMLAGEIVEDLKSLGAPRLGSRSDKLAAIALRQALASAGLDPAPRGALASAGLVIGATTGGVAATEDAVIAWRKRREFDIHRLLWRDCSSSADSCARLFGLGGPVATLSTACSSGALAIAAAAELIVAGEADCMAAGGADSLCRLTINGFNSLMLVDPAGCRPFDAARAGMSLGEGAAFLILEEGSAAAMRGAAILARLSGWGASCDAHHATAPHPEGLGALAAMRAAAACAGLEPREIGYVNAHGTGTADNDAAEGAAIRAFFGGGPAPFSSVKRFFGHTLAASGAIEAVVCVEAFRRGELPPNLGFETVDPAIGLAPIKEMTPTVAKHVISNSFGFGGNNAALVISEANSKSGTGVPARDFSARAAVIGLGAISPAGSTPETLFAALRAGGVAPERVVLAAPLPEGELLAYRCNDLPAKEELDAGRRRRLNRLLQMTVIAAKRARRAAGLEGAPGGEGAAICFGTGHGCMDDTVAFLENMADHDERAPMPARFINSVHNAPAGQAALELGARGLNSAPTHREISFEIGLWQAMAELASGRAGVAYAGAGDEQSDATLAVGNHLEWWTNASAPVRPFAPRDPAAPPRARPLPGEGAAVVALAPVGSAAAPLAIVSACAFGRTAMAGRHEIDAAREADWIESRLARAGERLEEIDVVLAGANGMARLDEMYRAVHAELARRAGRPIALAGYKQATGEFPSASALGFVAAVGLVRGDLSPSDLNVPSPSPRRVLLYTLSPTGTRAISLISAP